jgi:hypothetical protein
MLIATHHGTPVFLCWTAVAASAMLVATHHGTPVFLCWTAVAASAMLVATHHGTPVFLWWTAVAASAMLVATHHGTPVFLNLWATFITIENLTNFWLEKQIRRELMKSNPLSVFEFGRIFLLRDIHTLYHQRPEHNIPCRSMYCASCSV